jgi:phosphohistidine phosphatase
MRHTLVLVRHAKSDWSGTHPDHERPVGARGRRQAPEAGRWLAEHLPGIDVAVVSPAQRARTTWELVSAELPVSPPVRVEEDVYSFGPEPLLRVVRRLPGDVGTAALVGHNPALEELVEEVAGEWEAMPTSALAVIELSGPWADAGDGSARLVAAGRPPAAPLRER